MLSLTAQFRDRTVRALLLAAKVWTSAEDLERLSTVLEGISRPGADSLLRAAQGHGVVPQVQASIARVYERNPGGIEFLLEQAQRLAHDREQWSRRLMLELSEFARASRMADAPFLPIKGIAMLHWYPLGSRRAIGDIDVLIEPRSAWRALGALRPSDYSLRRVRLERFRYARLPPGTFGIGEVEYRPMRRVLFDMHFGVYGGCGPGALECEIWSNAAANHSDHAPWGIPSREDCLLVACAHIIREGHVTLKDINDAAVLFTPDPGPLDWEYVRRTAHRNALDEVLMGLLDAARLAYPRLEPGFPHRRPGRARALRVDARRPKSSTVDLRRLQVMYLYRYCRPRAGRLKALHVSARGAWYLAGAGRGYGRPYSVNEPSRRHRRQPCDRLVAVALVPRSGRRLLAVESIDLARAAVVMADTSTSRWCAADVLAVAARGHPEILLTPQSVLLESSYAGSVEPKRLTRAQTAAWNVLMTLATAGAASVTER